MVSLLISQRSSVVMGAKKNATEYLQDSNSKTLRAHNNTFPIVKHQSDRNGPVRMWERFLLTLKDTMQGTMNKRKNIELWPLVPRSECLSRRNNSSRKVRDRLLSEN